MGGECGEEYVLDVKAEERLGYRGLDLEEVELNLQDWCAKLDTAFYVGLCIVVALLLGIDWLYLAHA